ncbi:MAG: MerR family transcriptional regulator [Desulfobacterium sp.]|nr:MerR family transcriptional regulator [Desulfobacterium sp.]
MCIYAGYRKKNHTDNHVIQNNNYSGLNQSYSYLQNYQIKLEIPVFLFKSGYPMEVNTFGDLVKKTRMDLHLEIKQLAAQLGVSGQSIINIEMNRTQSSPHLLKVLVAFIKGQHNGSMSEEQLWQLCFKNNPLYPKHQNTFGDRLRADRMQNFLSIKQMSKILEIDPTTLGRWENDKSKPHSVLKKRILKWNRAKLL